MSDIQPTFLCEGCQSPESIAQLLADFVKQATRTIDICIYSFNLCPDSRDILLDALRERAGAGVAVRIAYEARTQQVEQMGNDYCDMSTPRFVAGLGFPFRAIEGERV